MSKKKEKPDPVVTCPYCNQLALWTENKAVYGRNYGRSYMCYLCKQCDSYVGCHSNTKQPLGTMANRQLREWRMRAHNLLDPLWKSGKFSRGQIYGKLKGRIGKVVHVGESDIEQCKLIITALQEIIKEYWQQQEAIEPNI